MPFGSIIGGALGLLGSGRGGQSQTVNNDPWGPQQDYLRDIFTQAHDLYYGGGPQYYPGQTYVNFSPQSEMGMSMIEDRALQGSPLNQASQDYTQSMLSGSNPALQAYSTFLNPTGQQTLQSTAAGDSLEGNPYLDRMYNRAADAVTDQFNNTVLPGINATFGSAGRTGGGLHQQAVQDAGSNLADSLGGMATDIYGGNYQRERDRQLSASTGMENRALGALGSMANLQTGAAQFAPSIANQDYIDADRMLGVGRMVEDRANQALQGDIDRFNFYQNAPEQNLANYQGFIQGNYGGQQQTSSSNQGNPLMGALGGAMMGSQFQQQMPNFFGGSPFGSSGWGGTWGI